MGVPRRAWAAVLLVGCLAACAAANEPVESDPVEPEPAVSGNWIEIPLTDGTFRESSTAYRTDAIDVPIEAKAELEYQVAIREGDSIVYTWAVEKISDPALLTSEFHGHTERVGDAPGTLIFYRKSTGGSESGALVAPFTGIHGWYLVNGTDAPIVVRLNLAGFYALIEQ